jgi:hypothetical protein
MSGFPEIRYFSVAASCDLRMPPGNGSEASVGTASVPVGRRRRETADLSRVQVLAS